MQGQETLGRACLANADDPVAVECLTQLKRNLITATAASSLISTFITGMLANLPLALAPGLGIAAYVAYQVVGIYGAGELTYEETMATIFIESWIFILLSITGVRGGLIKYMPKTVALASSVGIGLLLAFTGLRNLDVVVFDSSTLVQLGGCNADSRQYVYAFDSQLNVSALPNATSIILAEADVYGCVGGQMRSPTMWLGIAGGFISAILLYMGVKGALIIGIAFVTIISWIPGHAATYLGSTSSIPGAHVRGGLGPCEAGAWGLGGSAGRRGWGSEVERMPAVAMHWCTWGPAAGALWRLAHVGPGEPKHPRARPLRGNGLQVPHSIPHLPPPPQVARHGCRCSGRLWPPRRWT